MSASAGSTILHRAPHCPPSNVRRIRCRPCLDYAAYRICAVIQTLEAYRTVSVQPELSASAVHAPLPLSATKEVYRKDAVAIHRHRCRRFTASMPPANCNHVLDPRGLTWKRPLPRRRQQRVQKLPALSKPLRQRVPGRLSAAKR